MSGRASQWPSPQPPTTALTRWRLVKSTTAYGHRRRTGPGRLRTRLYGDRSPKQSEMRCSSSCLTKTPRGCGPGFSLNLGRRNGRCSCAADGGPTVGVAHGSRLHRSRAVYQSGQDFDVFPLPSHGSFPATDGEQLVEVPTIVSHWGDQAACRAGRPGQSSSAFGPVEQFRVVRLTMFIKSLFVQLVLLVCRLRQINGFSHFSPN